MRRLQRLLTALLLLAPLISGCGAGQQQAQSQTVTQHHLGFKLQESWTSQALESKPLTITLRISPSTKEVTPLAGRTAMSTMNMTPVKIDWHKTPDSEYEGRFTPSMAGSWRVNIPFQNGVQTWQESFVINVR